MLSNASCAIHFCFTHTTWCASSNGDGVSSIIGPFARCGFVELQAEMRGKGPSWAGTNAHHAPSRPAYSSCSEPGVANVRGPSSRELSPPKVKPDDDVLCVSFQRCPQLGLLSHGLQPASSPMAGGSDELQLVTRGSNPSYGRAVNVPQIPPYTPPLFWSSQSQRTSSPLPSSTCSACCAPHIRSKYPLLAISTLVHSSSRKVSPLSSHSFPSPTVTGSSHSHLQTLT